MGDEIVVYDLATDRAHLLNASAAAIWSRCQDGATVAELRAALEAQLATNGTTDDILATALADLGAAGLLVAAAQVPYSAPFISRRSLLKKAGIAAVALPAVTTILAPPAAATHTAIGCTGPLGACTQGEHADCCTGTSCQQNVAGNTVCCTRQLAAACSPGEVCCDGACVSGKCCKASTTSCRNSADCCAGLACNPTTLVCQTCLANGTTSGGVAQLCCSGQQKTIGAVQRCCGNASGGSCSNDGDCCSGFTCTGPTGNKTCTAV